MGNAMYGEALGHRFLSRGLAEMNNLLPWDKVETIVGSRGDHQDTRVLEIGCGEGRFLMELRREFRDIEIFGVNKHPWAVMKGTESLRAVSQHYQTFHERELERIAYPQVFFTDASRLPFAADYLDLIVSQECFHLVEEKAEAIEEIIRTLKPGGVAHIHLDSVPVPHSEDCKLPTPRLVIFDKGEIVPIDAIINARAQGVATAKLSVLPNADSSQKVMLSIQKQRAGNVELGLETLDVLPPTFYDGLARMQYGTRTAYRA